MVFMDKSGLILLGIVSSFMHEMGHVFAIKLRGYEVDNINLGCVSADMFLKYHNFNDIFIILLSGSMMNFLIAAVFKILSFYISHDVIHAIYCQNMCIGVLNLLPVAVLDGGCILLLVLSKKTNICTAYKILNILSFLFAIPVFVFGIGILKTSGYNFSLLMVGIYLILCIFFKENTFL